MVMGMGILLHLAPRLAPLAFELAPLAFRLHPGSSNWVRERSDGVRQGSIWSPRPVESSTIPGPAFLVRPRAAS